MPRGLGADHRFDVFELLLLLWAIEEHVVPMRWVKVF
jgi:hypothetical protein